MKRKPKGRRWVRATMAGLALLSLTLSSARASGTFQLEGSNGGLSPSPGQWAAKSTYETVETNVSEGLVYGNVLKEGKILVSYVGAPGSSLEIFEGVSTDGKAGSFTARLSSKAEPTSEEDAFVLAREYAAAGRSPTQDKMYLQKASLETSSQSDEGGSGVFGRVYTTECL